MKLGLSQEKLADAAGIQPRSLSRIEAGCGVVTATLFKVLATLNSLEKDASAVRSAAAAVASREQASGAKDPVPPVADETIEQRLRGLEALVRAGDALQDEKDKRIRQLEADLRVEAHYRLEVARKCSEQQDTIDRMQKMLKNHGELIARLLGKSNQRDGEIRDAINRLNESVAAFSKSAASKPSSLITKIFGG